jgi:hypothetical protein
MAGDSSYQATRRMAVGGDGVEDVAPHTPTPAGGVVRIAPKISARRQRNPPAAV